MSEILTINTEAGIKTEEQYKPLPLYDETLPMLESEIPMYNLRLPNPQMTKLVSEMKMTMKQFGGIGLSANQCGVYERVFVIGTDQFQIACINPKIIESSDNKIKAEEGCLSYPGLYLKIERPEWIVAEFTDENGETKQMRFDGVTARCYQHELDHMNGKKFVDYAGPVALHMARKKQSKIVKKVSRNSKKNLGAVYG
jgi:peptide deformylase